MNLQHDLFKLLKNDVKCFTNKDDLLSLENHISFVPPASRYAFELKLQNYSKPDFHVNIKRSQNLQKVVQFYQKQEFSSNEHWQIIIDFLSKWERNYNQYKDYIEGIFLEYDYLQKNNFTQAPSLFVKLESKELGKTKAFDFLQTLIVDLKGNTFFSAAEPTIRRLFEHNTTSYIGYFAIMFSRGDNILRLNSYQISTDELSDYLQVLQWQGNKKLLNSIYPQLKAISDKIIVSYDIVEGKVANRLGLELFFEDDSKWAALLEFCSSWITEKQLIEYAQNNWNKSFTPFNNLNFPVDLMIESLKTDRFQVPLIQQKISHLKLVIGNDEKPEVKLYLVCNSIKQTYHV